MRLQYYKPMPDEAQAPLQSSVAFILTSAALVQKPAGSHGSDCLASGIAASTHRNIKYEYQQHENTNIL